MYNFIMFDRLFFKLERQVQGRGPNQKCVKITFNLPLVNAPINALHLRKWHFLPPGVAHTTGSA